MVDSSPKAPRRSHFRELFWHTLLRMMLLYFLPLLLLGFFFNFQYRRIVTTSEHAHLAVIAEHQAHTLDLFLRERLVNLANVIDDPHFRQSLNTPGSLRKQLVKLRQMSSAFVDIAIVDGEGKLVHYRGPVDFPRPVDYRNERWYLSLLSPTRQSVITDIYKGFRKRPHFTIAVKRISDGNVMILRAALSAERIAEYLTTLEGANEVNASVVNGEGTFQVVTPRVGRPLDKSPYKLPVRGQRQESDRSGDFAHAWLSEVPWALVVENTSRPKGVALSWLPNKLLLATFMAFTLMGVVMTLRARQLVRGQLRTERNQAELSGQLVQAAKLASVGELAAGIAHEINNPLAIIAEEIGLLKDSLDPELADEDEEIDLEQHLDIMYQAVFRCRDITRKLLSFVRKENVKIDAHDLHSIIDEVIDGMLNNELSISNIETVRDYDPLVQRVVTDRNQLIQVILNLVKNAIDSMPGGGVLTIQTTHQDQRVRFSVNDTGCGMTPEQLEKVFTPFFTTKDPGRGTGLGLSVSFNIVESFGGKVFVNSVPDRGSVFTVELPYTFQASHPSPRLRTSPIDKGSAG